MEDEMINFLLMSCQGRVSAVGLINRNWAKDEKQTTGPCPPKKNFRISMGSIAKAGIKLIT